jgi:hypothetical protein
MLAVNPKVNVNVRAEIRQDLDRLEQAKNLEDLFKDYAFQEHEPIRLVPPSKIQVNFERELADAITHSSPKPTKSGVNGSFFIIDRDGKPIAVFKPMNMETGMPRNPRMAPDRNVQFRRTILPGQGVGNEVLAYYLDHHGFCGRYGIAQTMLVSVGHRDMSSKLELGSAQRFIPNAKPLASMSQAEMAQIPRGEWDKLNFRLITGSTDAHLGNILYCPFTRSIHLIDSGDDFVGADGQCQYYNPWASIPMAYFRMSENEYRFLANIDLNSAITAFDACARNNELANDILRVSPDKYLTQLLRLYLARVVGEMRLTQYEWCCIMSRRRMQNGAISPSEIEKVYDSWIRIHQNSSTDWKKIVPRINWTAVVGDLRFLAKSYISRRELL